MCRHFALIIRPRLSIVNCLAIRPGEDARSLLQLIILLSGRRSPNGRESGSWNRLQHTE